MTKRLLSTSLRPVRPAPTLACQRVGGCPGRVVLTMLLIAALLAGSCLACVWSRTEEYTEGYQNSELAGKLKELLKEQERLKAEAAALRSPERLETIAASRLGMALPGEDQIHVVLWSEAPDKNSISTVAARDPVPGPERR